MNRFEIPNIVEFDFPDLDPEFILVTDGEIRNNKFNDERLSHLIPMEQSHASEYIEFATFFSYAYTIAYIVDATKNIKALYTKAHDMADKINASAEILNSPYRAHTVIMNEGKTDSVFIPPEYSVFRIIISEHKFDLKRSEYWRLHNEFASRKIKPWKAYDGEYFIAFKLKSQLSKRWIAKIRESNPNIDSLPSDTYIPISDKKYKRVPFYSQPAYKSIVKPAITFGVNFAGECTPELIDGYIGVTDESPRGPIDDYTASLGTACFWTTDDTKIFYVKFGSITPETELRDPKYPTTPLGWFMRFKPKCELTPYRIKKLRAANVDLDSIPDDTYIPMNDREYYSAPANSKPITKQVAILEDAWDTLRDNKYIGYVDEPAEGFMTPEGVFYVEFS